jgi:tetratricopeptide (TPR) repeat protein
MEKVLCPRKGAMQKKTQGEGIMMMKRCCWYIGFFMFISLSLAACNKPAPPTIYSGLKSAINENAKKYNASGLAFAEKEQYREAIEAYKKAIFEEPAFVDAHINCSKAYFAIGNYDMANYYNMKAKEIAAYKERVIRESEEDQKK